jgi:hypothetical protein
VAWDKDDAGRGSGRCFVDSPGKRQLLEDVVTQSNEVFGAGTHWIEEVVGIDTAAGAPSDHTADAAAGSGIVRKN